MSSRTALLALVLAFGFTQQSGTAPGPASQEPEKPAAAAAVAPASPAPAAPVNVPAAAASSAAPVATPAHPVIADGMSTVYFYRPRLYRGGAVRIGLFVDGTMAVNLVNGRWASIQVPAGHHIIRPKDDQSGIEIDAEPGQSYYFRSGWGEAGLFHNAHKNIMIVMKEQATYEIKQLKPLDQKDLVWPAGQAGTATK
jgi:hypothetical protein